MFIFFKSVFYAVQNEKQKEVLKLIGESIKTHRLQNCISRCQLALDLNTDEKHIRRIENGEVNATILSLIKICKSIKLDFAFLDEIKIDSKFFEY